MRERRNRDLGQVRLRLDMKMKGFFYKRRGDWNRSLCLSLCLCVKERVLITEKKEFHVENNFIRIRLACHADLLNKSFSSFNDI